MSNDLPDDEGIPVLRDVVRHGNRRTANGDTGSTVGATGLTEAEIEAIAARVVERHANAIEAAVARAIRAALEDRSGEPTQE